MELGAIDADNAFIEYPVFSAHPSGASTVLGDFHGLFVNSQALSNAPRLASDIEFYLKYDVAVSVVFDTGINIHFLPGLAKIQRDKPAVYIGNGSTKNALLTSAGKSVEIYNTGPVPLCPKTDITVVPPLVKPHVAPCVLTSVSEGAIPVYPLCTVEQHRFESELNKLIDTVRAIADCECSIGDSATTNSVNYVSGLTANIFESLMGNSLWTAMIRAVSDQTGATENEDIMCHMLRIFKEHWYPYLHLGTETGPDDYMFSTNNDMIASLIHYISENMNEPKLGEMVRGLGNLDNPAGDEVHVVAFRQLWNNRVNTYKLFSALTKRLNKFEALNCGYIQSSGSDSGVIAPGGRMFVILPQ